MEALTGRLKREHATLTCMAVIYCGDHHEHGDSKLCDQCDNLMSYSERRLQKCPYGQAKPTCANCPVHCYKKAQRQEVRRIMRYAGPRMIWRHPIRALTHSFDKLRRVLHPMDLRRGRSGGS
jgi:hypothetical protein